jgi:hypothetical protein
VLQRTSKGGCPKCRDPHSLKTIVEVIFLFLEKWETTAGHRPQATGYTKRYIPHMESNF